jgi:hypothetical protein
MNSFIPNELTLENKREVVNAVTTMAAGNPMSGRTLDSMKRHP